jgi:hypothetical protein
MSKETAVLPSPPTAKSSLCDFMDDSFAGASPLSATVDAEGYVSSQPFVNMRSSKLTTMISSFKSSLKPRNRYTRFDAMNTASISPISMSSREKQVSRISCAGVLITLMLIFGFDNCFLKGD